MNDAKDLIGTYGPAVGGVVTAVLAALGIKSEHGKRLAALEEKVDKLSKDLAELDDKLTDQIREVERESMTPDGIRALMAEAMRPLIDKVIDLRERVADLAGAVKSLGG